MVDGATEWARRVMAAALIANMDWLVIDEIGPLELHHGQGFAFALEPLSDSVRVPNAIVMVRESLVDELAERLGRLDTLRIHVTADARSQLPDYLASLVRSA
jgi:nucleoside-triphosphatase THEP1